MGGFSNFGTFRAYTTIFRKLSCLIHRINVFSIADLSLIFNHIYPKIFFLNTQNICKNIHRDKKHFKLVKITDYISVNKILIKPTDPKKALKQKKHNSVT